MRNTKENISPQHEHFEFKSTNILLTSAILAELPDTTFVGFEDSVEKNRKLFVIRYPKPEEFEINKFIQKYEDKTLTVNLFYYNRHLNYLRDRLFVKKTEKRDGTR